MQVKPKVAFHTLGCKLNQAETELLARRFTEAGYFIASGDKADIYVLNTCTVTHIADRKSRHLLRMWRKRNREAFIVATGCYAERAPQELSQIGADLVVGNEQKMHLPQLVKDKHISASHGSPQEYAVSSTNRVRSFIKIQDGCTGSCAYCVVPRVRTREYSLPAAEIVEEVKARASSGYKEVILTGTEIGAYGYNGTNLKSLIEQILADTDIERLHLSSLQPQEVSPELLNLWQDPRLCRHFHLALQGGSDAVLQRMRRRYSIADYTKAVSSIRKAIPDAAITTDVIVGFPGETEDEFEESYRFCREIGFADIHVFTYSPRAGTLAAEMPEQVNHRIKKERSLRMLDLAQQGAHKFCEALLGQNMTVLWEKEVTPGNGIYSGLSNNYVRIFTKSPQPLTNALLPVQMVGLHKEGLWGEVIK